MRGPGALDGRMQSSERPAVQFQRSRLPSATLSRQFSTFNHRQSPADGDDRVPGQLAAEMCDDLREHDRHLHRSSSRSGLKILQRQVPQSHQGIAYPTQQLGGRPVEEGREAITRIPFANGSLTYFISSWGEFEALRGTPADLVAVDELQDIQSEALPVIEESLSHSKYGMMRLVGTASDEGSEFAKLWNLSDMKEWDKEAKAWIPQKPENHMYSGYHIDQQMATWLSTLPPDNPASIPAKKARYSERRFLNEVLGLFYRGLAKPLLTEDMLACEDKTKTLLDGLGPPYWSYMGVDWGGGERAHTVVWIMGMDTLDRWRLLYISRMTEKDPMKQVRIIANLINDYRVRQAVADIGYGAVQVSELQKLYADRVLGCQYMRRPEIPLERKHTEEFGKRIAQMMLYADKSFWIETAINLIKFKDPSGKVVPKLVIPWRVPADVEWIVDEFTCIEMEEQETVGGKRYHHYTHPEGQPDDALHAFVYALIANDIYHIYPELSIRDLNVRP